MITNVLLCYSPTQIHGKMRYVAHIVSTVTMTGQQGTAETSMHYADSCHLHTPRECPIKQARVYSENSTAPPMPHTSKLHKQVIGVTQTWAIMRAAVSTAVQGCFVSLNAFRHSQRQHIGPDRVIVHAHPRAISVVHNGTQALLHIPTHVCSTTVSYKGKPIGAHQAKGSLGNQLLYLSTWHV